MNQCFFRSSIYHINLNFGKHCFKHSTVKQVVITYSTRHVIKYVPASYFLYPHLYIFSNASRNSTITSLYILALFSVFVITQIPLILYTPAVCSIQKVNNKIAIETDIYVFFKLQCSFHNAPWHLINIPQCFKCHKNQVIWLWSVKLTNIRWNIILNTVGHFKWMSCILMHFWYIFSYWMNELSIF